MTRDQLLAEFHGQLGADRPTLVIDTAAGSRIESSAGSAHSKPLALVNILNPFARALRDEVDLNELLHSDPDTGNAKLDGYVEETRSELRDAVSQGGGICYLLEGARAGCCSPMQYGGYYLERDRELLEEFRNLGQDAPDTHGLAHATVLYVVGGEDVYLDFVSDLPADVFAWDSAASGFDSKYVRSLRQGVQASADADSEIEFRLASGDFKSQISNLKSGEGDISPDGPTSKLKTSNFVEAHV